MGGRDKQRIDTLLVERKIATTREHAWRLLGAGAVFVDGQLCDKAGHLVTTICTIRVKPGKKFVSRAGEKLEAGLEGLAVAPAGFICADIGCSTGGFTDCLLQHGAAKVYSVDVGYGVLDWKLRQHPKVVVLERTNARFLSQEQIPEPLNLAVIDASFISLELLLAPLLPLFSEDIRILALVKPQFQLPREKIGPGGIVRDEALHLEALEMVQQFGHNLGLHYAGAVPSPLQGMKGNKEFLLLFTGKQRDLARQNNEEFKHR